MQLSPTTTVESFFKRHPALYKGVSKVYSFGSFHGFGGNFDIKSVELLRNLTSEVMKPLYV